jgi:gamma-glutamyltranspeptidase
VHCVGVRHCPSDKPDAGAEAHDAGGKVGVVCAERRDRDKPAVGHLGGARGAAAGGNAIDVAVDAAAVLTVVEPNMTGVGGDLSAMVWSARDRTLHGLNASGRSGSLMTRETPAARGRTGLSQGIEAVTIPGSLSGCSRAWT